MCVVNNEKMSDNILICLVRYFEKQADNQNRKSSLFCKIPALF